MWYRLSLCIPRVTVDIDILMVNFDFLTREKRFYTCLAKDCDQTVFENNLDLNSTFWQPISFYPEDL